MANQLELVRNEDTQDPIVVMRREIKYLSNTEDKSRIFDYMGYIEIGNPVDQQYVQYLGDNMSMKDSYQDHYTYGNWDFSFLMPGKNKNTFLFCCTHLNFF